MIQHVRGTVEHRAADHVIVDVGGIGLRLEAAPSVVAGLGLGDHHQVPTSLVVREDSWTLYGFADTDEREVFELVQGVSGIGPRTAQALVATLSADGLRQAVTRKDEAMITTVPGIGKKGAQRILLELTDRLGPVQGAATPSASESVLTAGWREAVLSGLVGLGWSAREAQAAVDAIAERTPADSSVADALKAALRELQRA